MKQALLPTKVTDPAFQMSGASGVASWHCSLCWPLDANILTFVGLVTVRQALTQNNNFTLGFRVQALPPHPTSVGAHLCRLQWKQHSYRASVVPKTIGAPSSQHVMLLE